DPEQQHRDSYNHRPRADAEAKLAREPLVQDVPWIDPEPGQQEHRTADAVQHEPGEQLAQPAWAGCGDQSQAPFAAGRPRLGFFCDAQSRRLSTCRASRNPSTSAATWSGLRLTWDQRTDPISERPWTGSFSCTWPAAGGGVTGGG